jgi:hypothetical protein
MLKLTAVIALSVALFYTTGAIPPTARSQTDTLIADIAARSACARHIWRNRGRAPVGYIKGMALVYAKSFCESKSSADTAATVMRQPLQGAEDALVHYGIGSTTEIERLRALYTLGIGLGMRESSGNTTEGRDTTVRNPTASNAEAGLFQQSFDSFNRSPALARLFDQYKANTDTCRLETFMEGIRDKRRNVVGTGPGAEFQRFTKACPAFATEYAMVMLRVNRRHFGPINRREAEVVQQCNDMLREVETVATCTP